jgi:2'-5' RNA ligase
VTRHAVVAYLRFDAEHEAWVKSVRSANDPQARLIDAHFTLMFPLICEADTLVAHVKQLMASFSSFSVTLARVVAQRDVVSGGSHVFLVPSEGGDQIRRIHDELYATTFRAHLREDVPYLPHVTVGASATFEECASLAEALNQGAIDVRARIDAIDIISVGVDGIASAGHVPLAAAASAGA